MFYNEQVHAFVGSRFPSPALNYLVEDFLKELVRRKQAEENNPVWHVPLSLSYDSTGTSYVVGIENEANLLYLDFDA